VMTAIHGVCYDSPDWWEKWIAWYGSCPTLPNTLVTTQITKYGATSYVDIVFSDIPAGEFDVANAVTYVGWCVDPDGRVAETPDQFNLYCSVGSSMGDVPWNKINYLLNHKVAGAGIMEIQYAIWHLVANAWGTVPGWLYEHPDFWTTTAQGMYNDAASNGENFIPAPDNCCSHFSSSGRFYKIWWGSGNDH